MDQIGVNIMTIKLGKLVKKEYIIHLDNLQIGTTKFEKADAPMGVVIGTLKFVDDKYKYMYLKNYCKINKIELSLDYPKDKMISTGTIPELKVTNNLGVEINGVGNQITGMDSEEYEISIFGISYPFYGEEFPHHVNEYNKIFNDK